MGQIIPVLLLIVVGLIAAFVGYLVGKQVYKAYAVKNFYANLFSILSFAAVFLLIGIAGWFIIVFGFMFQR